MSSAKTQSSYWKTLPRASFYQFLLTIFIIFSITGFVNDVFSAGQLALWRIAFDGVLNGLLAVGWVFMFTHRRFWLLPLFLLIHSSYFWVTFKTDLGVLAAANLQLRLYVDGIGIILLLLLGYIFLIRFVTTEGIKHLRMKTEMDLARSMHQTLVPDIQLETPYYRVWGRSLPQMSIGGDILDARVAEEELVCYLADVSGHGVKAGLLMGMFKTAMHMQPAKQSPAALLERTNRVLYRLSEKNMFLTCACVRFKPDRTAEFTLAGHLPILHLRPTTNELQQLVIKQIPIAVKSDYSFKSRRVQIQSGDLFFLFSDGLVEVHNDKHEEFGLERFERTIQANRDLSPDTLLEILLETCQKFGSQADDQTLLIVQCK